MASVETRLQGDAARAPVAAPPSEVPAVFGYLAAVGMTAVATILAVAIDGEVTIPNLSLVFVLPVIVAAVGFGLGPSLCSAVLGALAYNFFLTEPRYTLRVDDPANIWAIGLLFVVGCIASAVASTSRRRALEAALRGRQASVLQAYGRDVRVAEDAKAIAAVTARSLAALFRVPAVAMLLKDDAVLGVETAGGADLQEAEVEAARSAAATVVRAGVYPADASRFDFWPVATAQGRRAVIGLAFDPDERPKEPDTLVDIVAATLALALDRQAFRDGRDAGPAAAPAATRG
ncbi:DUF4118 domain-containing protein [Labrys wisconsinensis]|uniref:Two-component system sensor histidine kinase KdpD n=1 Tax=Labrys wisconsinensis TaxID=425677 RepID=A0ABU0J9J7_9HYPH|nr:DUF4118 domain-containing protein [Labrys wisconsinensis]MDQ0470949.1 two-component system sensor histidine kinase KdpD [Labrys wisconsinensis]